ncbi:nucleotidyltransferase-like protein [Muricomes intestini]|jgi:predicted nucleotidyltransferase|uniref:Nucleotidyltransferase-like protein n=2 Tax=Muricomes intestini TaxID=1796634 RepID=A0A4R3K2F9_9FIRM|nr:nucleotidyltransferase-like protein [Muricomes intestini]
MSAYGKKTQWIGIAKNLYYGYNIDNIIHIHTKGAGSMEHVHDILIKFSKEVRKIIGDSLKKVIVYGSYARGDYSENSDIDIMILTTLSDDEIRKVENTIYDIAFDFQMDYLVDISVIVKNEKQFQYWLGALPFYDNVQKEGVVISG